MIEGRRAYAETVRWMRAARAPARARAGFARRAAATCLWAGVGIMGFIGLVAPSRFGSPGSRTLGTGWPSYVVMSLVAATALTALLRRDAISTLAMRIRDPFVRPLGEDPSFEGAADALAACPGALKTRFALAWVWRPAGLFGLGVVCALSTSYFVIDAVLARGVVGLGQIAYAAGFLIASLFFFALAATKLSTWRLALSVYKEVTSGYGQ